MMQQVKTLLTAAVLSLLVFAPSTPFADSMPLPAAPADQTQQTGHGYINSDGKWISSPVHAATVPNGATAQCSDGSYSFSQHRQGTCSHHGGVARWL